MSFPPSPPRSTWKLGPYGRPRPPKDGVGYDDGLDGIAELRARNDAAYAAATPEQRAAWDASHQKFLAEQAYWIKEREAGRCP